MKILKLTPNVERPLLRRRHERDLEAQRVASRIVDGCSKRGDVALRQWTKKFDGVDLRYGIWVSAAEIDRAGNKR